MKMHIVEVKRNGKIKYVLDIRYPPGKRVRHTHDTYREAAAERKALKAQVQVSGTVWETFSAREQAEVLFLVSEVKILGVTFRELVESYKRQLARRPPRVALIQVIHETIRVARMQNDRPRYIEKLDYVLRRFAIGRELVPISEITLNDIESWLNGQRGHDRKSPAAAATIIGLRGKLYALFAEAVRKQYIEDSANPMKRVLCPKLPSVRQPFFKAPAMADLLWVCRQTDKPFLGWLVLGAFVGIRPEELERLEWRCVDLDRGEIVIDEDVSKTRRRRIIELSECGPLKEWLLEADRTYRYIVPVDANRADEKELKRVRQVIKRHRERLCERAGVEWHPDILRKTAATHLLVLHESEDKVAMILGNSPKIIHKHYRGLARREETEAFMALTPATVKNDLIKLPPGGYGKTKTGKLI